MTNFVNLSVNENPFLPEFFLAAFMSYSFRSFLTAV